MPGVCLLLVVCVGGCGQGPHLYPVTGEVILATGAPLSGGIVEFRSVGTQPPWIASGVVDANGTFRLRTEGYGDGTIAGEYQAIVSPPAPGERDGIAAQPVGLDFRDYASTPLRYEVTPSQETHHYRIDLSVGNRGPKAR